MTLVTRDPEAARRLCPDLPSLRAPAAEVPHWASVREPASFAEVLQTLGAHHPSALRELVRAWRDLLVALAPDALVLDYAPFALLALQDQPAARVLLGTGFACPPDVSPLPDLRPWQDHYPDRLLFSELAVLDAFNACLSDQGQPPLPRLASLFRRVDANLLTSFPALDHYQGRLGPSASAPEAGTAGPAVEYVGVWSDLAGLAPVWPEGRGRPLFAYLKPFPALGALLEHLAHLGLPTLVYLSGDTPDSRAWPDCPSLRITRSPIDMARAARAAGLAICHGGHGTVATQLLAGTPVLAIPLVVEQRIVADNLERIGAGAAASADDAAAILATLDRLLDDPAPAAAAAAFAAAHAGQDPAGALEYVIRRIEGLATARQRV